MSSVAPIRPELLESAAGRFFSAMTGRARTIVFMAVIMTLGLSAPMFRLRLDTTMDAFISSTHPAVLFRDRVRDAFNLSEPVVVAIVNEGQTGVFNPDTLALVQWFTDAIASLESIDVGRVRSLATEKNIAGAADGLDVSPFFDSVPETQAEADDVRARVMDFPFYVGTLVSADGKATLVVADIGGDIADSRAYREIRALVESAPVHREKIFVAGDAAVSEYFGRYVFMDSVRLTPAVFLVVSIILFVAYRRARGVLLPNLVVMSAVGTALGVMAALDVPFYNITNALPVLLVAIGVADGIHILGEYYEHSASHPDFSGREVVIHTMTRMWWPVTVTSLTDVAGFMALGKASYMPPMHAFGYFASLGVLVAWLFSLVVLPSVLSLMPLQRSRAFRAAGGRAGAASDRFGRFMAGVGYTTGRRPVLALAVTGCVVVAGVAGTTRLKIDENRIENFQRKEQIYKADALINEMFEGTTFLDILIETPETEGLFRPERLARIEGFEHAIRQIPHVKNTVSVLDLIKQMNRAMNNGDKKAYRLPGDSSTIAQYFLLYAAGGDEEDLEPLIDYDRRAAVMRVALDTGWVSDFGAVIGDIQSLIGDIFRDSDITVRTTGRVDVDFHWMQGLIGSHFRGVLLAMVAVWMMVSGFLRSPMAGVVALIPVSFAVLLIYACMGLSGIALDVSTSMFAAIILGCGVDFAVHTLDSLITLTKKERKPLEEAFRVLFPSTGRALLFNFSAIFTGFVVLMISQVPAIKRFGVLACVAVVVSFLATMFVLPPLLTLFEPRFLMPEGTATLEKR